MADCICGKNGYPLNATSCPVHGTWRPIETAPKDKMFIWASPKGEGNWSLGLAYRNVSGGWSDAYGSDAPRHATHWTPLPEPPSLSRYGYEDDHDGR